MRGHAYGCSRRPEGGFVLIAALLLTLLISALLAYFSLQVDSGWEVARNLEAQLHSLTLAGNGLEYARALLPGVDLNRLLAGPDGRFQAGRPVHWRDPLNLKEAAQLDPARWHISSDDGLLTFVATKGSLNHVYHSPDGGYFVLRFSNNPEEDPSRDLDHEVLVRSLGVAPKKIPLLPGGKNRNSIALIEARFRQERFFDLPGAVTFFGGRIELHLAGSRTRIDGGLQPALCVISPDGASPLQRLLRSLAPDAATRITGWGSTPSAREETSTYRASPNYRRAFSPAFWHHFVTHLPRFRDKVNPGIHLFADGGTLEGDLRGIVVVRGKFILAGEGQVTGLLIHLGAGSLTLRDSAEVRGAVWLSNIDSSAQTLKAGPVRLQLSDFSSIRFDRRAVDKAVALFPPTEIYRRIIFPEMKH